MSGRVEMTYGLAMAAAQDAGNRSMREGRRAKWAVKDWNVACETFERLYPSPKKSGTSNQHHERGGG